MSPSARRVFNPYGMYTDRPTYEEAFHLLLENLTTLYEAESIPVRVFHRKKSPDLVIRAINAADRLLASLRKRAETVCLFIPAGTHIILLGEYDEYADSQDASISGADYGQNEIDYFLGQEPWIELRSIISPRALVYPKHPLHGENHAGSVLRVNGLDFRMGGRRVMDFNTETRILRLSKPFDEDVFLVFEGTLSPRQIRPSDEFDRSEVRLHTPGLFEGVLMDVALRNLLPGVLDPIGADQVYMRIRSMEAGNGPVVTIPNGQTGGFPD